MQDKKKGGAVAAVKNVARKVGAVGTGLAVSGMAMASGGGEFDSATIITKIEAHALTASLIVGAFILAVWGLRAMGLLKGKS